MEYVQAARAVGAGHWRILRRHILPNCHGAADRPADLHLRLRRALRGDAELPRPRRRRRRRRPGATSSPRAASTSARRPGSSPSPGIALAITVLGLNLLGDGLRDVLDPRLENSAGLRRCSMLSRTSRTAFGTAAASVTAVDGRQLRPRAGRDPRHRRRVRQRQERHRAVDHGPAAAAAGPRRRAARSASRGADLLAAVAKRSMRRIRGAEHLDDLPGADDLAQPGVHRSATRSPRRCARTSAWSARRRATARVELLEKVGIPSAAPAHRRLPAPALRRHAPARDDRDGARLPAASC